MPNEATPLEYRTLFESLPDAYVLLRPDLTIVDATAAYLRATNTERRHLVGRHVFEVFPADPADETAADVAEARASMLRTLDEKRPHAREPFRYSIPSATGFEVRFWRTLNTPILDEHGDVAFILHRAEDVTEVMRLRRERAEYGRSLDEVWATSQRFSSLLDSAPDAMVIVEDTGRIQLVNRQTEHLFGYTRSELIGEPLEILIPERLRPSHQAHLRRFFAHPDSRPMGSGLQLFGRRKDGTELPIEVSLSPQQGERGVTVSAAIRDVSERKRLEEAARLTNDRLRSAVESIDDAFALFGADDRLILCNSVFRRLIDDGPPGALIGRDFREILDGWIDQIAFGSDEERARFREARVSRRAREQTSSVDVRMRDGRSLRIIDRRTAEGGFVKTIWDLTDDERRAAELREARAIAEAASAAKSEFLSSMSHELRTPLNAVLGFAQLLERDKREPLSERHRERVGQILRGGEHLLRLIDDILDLSRIESGNVSLSIEPVDIEEALQEVRRTLEPMATRQAITISVEPVPAGLPMARADRTRVTQILMNYGSNAIKYNRANGTVAFSVTRGEGHVRVTVADSGIGIPQDKQEKLFQPFQRAGQETGAIEGTGIGLVISKRLAELMGGSVGFASAADRGSMFWVELPIEQPGAVHSTEGVRPQLAASLPRSGTHRRVLYVEDNPANVTFMRDLMSTFDDVDLATAPTAELGIELARAHAPDVIIMDVNLPGMSGLDALRLLKASPETFDVPVIALTAAASDRDRQRGEQAGFYRYLTKPVKVDEFLDAMERALVRS